MGANPVMLESEQNFTVLVSPSALLGMNLSNSAFIPH